MWAIQSTLTKLRHTINSIGAPLANPSPGGWHREARRSEIEGGAKEVPRMWAAAAERVDLWAGLWTVRPEGASEGAGLGHRFLRHLQRTHLLLHLVDLAPFDPDTDPVHEGKAIVEELRKYDENLFLKPRWLVLNKLDLIPEEEQEARIKGFLEGYGTPEHWFSISGMKGDGCKKLIFAIQDYLDACC